MDFIIPLATGAILVFIYLGIWIVAPESKQEIYQRLISEGKLQ